MYYLSKGSVVRGSTEQILKVAHGRNVFELHGREAGLWLDGRFGIRSVFDPAGVKAIRHMERMGIVTSSEQGDAASRYEMLADCIYCPVAVKGIRCVWCRRDRRILTWLRSAGLHLSLAEIIYLEEHGVRPVPELLGEDNRQMLTERIYDIGMIQDGVLEREMAASPMRDVVISSILRLIKMKRVILL